MDHNLHAASSQWASRPADERFWNLREMRMACAVAKANSAASRMPFGRMKAVAVDGEVGLQSVNSGKIARFTHYAFGQLCMSVQAPAGYLRTLPAPLAASALDHGIQTRAAVDPNDRDLLFHKNGGLTLRAALSSRYDRVWDADVCAMLERLGDAGWCAPAGRTPPGYVGPTRIAEVADILPGQINIGVGTEIAPSGLYASDHDMFAFLVAPDRVIDDGAGHPLMRGIFVRNSEVGDASLSVTFFLMQAVCGNHIVWNATGVHEVSLRHIGKETAGRFFRKFSANLATYRDAAAAEEGKILAARNLVLGSSKEEVLEALLKYIKGHSLNLTKPRIEAALTVAEEHTDWYGNPRTLWAAVSGLTHASQGTGFADDRTEVDRAAGKLLAMAA